MSVDLLGYQFTLTEILLSAILFVVLLAFARIETLASRTYCEVADFRRDLEALAEEANERRRDNNPFP